MKKKSSILFIILMFVVCVLVLSPSGKIYKVNDVVSPNRFVLNGEEVRISGIETFDDEFTDRNKELAKSLGISEEEAFIFGKLGKYWATNLMKGRKVIVANNDIIYLRYSYKTKFMYSGFCLKDGKPYYQEAFDKKLGQIKRAQYKIMNVESGQIYDINKKNSKEVKDYILIRKSHIPKKKNIDKAPATKSATVLNLGDIKVLYTDLTAKLLPDRNCDTYVCKEILSNINNAQKTIDIAIYGYSSTPDIEKALSDAVKRGVKIRLVYDLDKNGNNIYPDTDLITKLIPNNNNDKLSAEANNIMHNKFYIFDDKVLITGSANLSHTDMSGFNTNSVVVINSPELSQIYKTEFEQMYNGKFHNAKTVNSNKSAKIGNTKIDVYFSPKDKSIANAVIPLINKAKKYIYIPTFFLTDKRVTTALINAKQRGVDIKIIMDALNASVYHSKHKELRNAGIQVKTENYAGKMHSKSIIIDDKYTIIGSMNFSNTAETKNDENLLVIENKKIAEFYKEFFLYQWSRIDDKWLKLNARAEGKDSIGSCSDGIDNNFDGLTDFEDPACQ